jgi:hypothetical protein
MATALARSWAILDNDSLTFVNAGLVTCDILQEMGRGDVAETLAECLTWREIFTPFDVATMGQNGQSSPVWV